MVARILSLGILAAVFAMTGCASPYQYGYGSPYGYGAPQGGAVYGAPQPMPGGYVSPPPGNMTGPATLGPASAPNWQPIPGAQSQPGPGTTFAPTPTERAVPNYSDPTRPDAAAPPADLGGSLTDPANETIRGPTGANTPAAPNTSGLIDSSNERIAALGDDRIRLPGELQPAGDQQLMPTPNNLPNPYAFDTSKYGWLRGIVNYDPHDRVWRITYDSARTDVHGGSFGLLPDDRFSQVFAEGRVHYVEGYIDNQYRDHFQRPMYRVTKAMLLRPARR